MSTRMRVDSDGDQGKRALRARKVLHESSTPEEKEEPGLESQRGLTWWSAGACGLLFLTIVVPLFFDTLVMKFVMAATAAAAVGFLLAMIAAVIAYAASGKSRAVMNITLTVASLVMTVFCIAGVSVGHSFAVKMEEERRAKGIETAVEIITFQWKQELERSGNARWTRTGDSAIQLADKVIARDKESTEGKLLSGCQGAMRDIAANATRHAEAVDGLFNSGGLSAESLKKKPECETRLAQLQAVSDASNAQLQAIRGFYERISKDLAKIDLDDQTRGIFVGRVQGDPLLSSAIRVRELDGEYTKHAIMYVTYLKNNSGRWSAVTKDHTIYLGQGMNVGEFNRISYLVNDTADKQIALQEQGLQSQVKRVSPKSARPDGISTSNTIR